MSLYSDVLTYSMTFKSEIALLNEDNYLHAICNIAKLAKKFSVLGMGASKFNEFDLLWATVKIALRSCVDMIHFPIYYNFV